MKRILEVSSYCVQPVLLVLSKADVYSPQSAWKYKDAMVMRMGAPATSGGAGPLVWTNGLVDCHKNKYATMARPNIPHNPLFCLPWRGVTCKGYGASGWGFCRKGRVLQKKLIGALFNFPEKHCPECGGAQTPDEKKATSDAFAVPVTLGKGPGNPFGTGTCTCQDGSRVLASDVVGMPR